MGNEREINVRCSFWRERGNADKKRVISPIQCPQLLKRNEGLGFESAQAFFPLLQLSVMLMISSIEKKRDQYQTHSKSWWLQGRLRIIRLSTSIARQAVGFQRYM